MAAARNEQMESKRPIAARRWAATADRAADDEAISRQLIMKNRSFINTQYAFSARERDGARRRKRKHVAELSDLVKNYNFDFELVCSACLGLIWRLRPCQYSGAKSAGCVKVSDALADSRIVMSSDARSEQ